MNFEVIKQAVEIEAADIPAMTKMSLGEYASYIESNLVFSDSHGVIRATQGEYPLACTKAQLNALIKFLQAKSSLLES
jgi:hypothetical protein